MTSPMFEMHIFICQQLVTENSKNYDFLPDLLALTLTKKTDAKAKRYLSFGLETRIRDVQPAVVQPIVEHHITFRYGSYIINVMTYYYNFLPIQSVSN
jgi:hypothetical protein